MTQTNDGAKRIEELKSIFLTLDDKGQEDALTILRSLNLSQLPYPPKHEGGMHDQQKTFVK